MHNDGTDRKVTIPTRYAPTPRSISLKETETAMDLAMSDICVRCLKVKSGNTLDHVMCFDTGEYGWAKCGLVNQSELERYQRQYQLDQATRQNATSSISHDVIVPPSLDLSTNTLIDLISPVDVSTAQFTATSSLLDHPDVLISLSVEC